MTENRDLKMFHQSAEENVLGSLILKPDLIWELPELSTTDFWLPQHQAVYAAIAECHMEGDRVEILRLESMLKGRHGCTLDFLMGLTAKVVSTETAPFHADMLRSKAIERDVRKRASEIAISHLEGEDLLAEAQRSLLEVNTKKSDSDAAQIGDVANAIVERVKRIRAGEKLPSGLRTGIPEFDYFLTLNPGEVLTFAGRPSMGKSAMTRWFIWQCVQMGERVLVFTTESHRETFTNQFLGMLSGVNSRQIARGDLEGWEMDLVDEARVLLRESPIFIDDVHKDVSKVGRQVRRYKARKQITMVVFDHLQEARNKEIRGHKKTEIIDSAVEGLRDVCTENPKCYLVLDSQLNRDVEKNDDKRPMMSNLKQSGTIEEVSDGVVLFYRAKQYYPDADESVLETTWAKNRNGPVGNMPVAWDYDNGQALGPLATEWSRTTPKPKETEPLNYDQYADRADLA